MFRFPESVPLGHYLHVSDKAVPRAQTTALLLTVRIMIWNIYLDVKVATSLGSS
jgi:hypothetical protein